MKNVLVTGATGFIGSHTIIELLANNFNVIGIDNFTNSRPDVVDRIKEITKKDFNFYNIDLLNSKELKKIFSHEDFDFILHFAGLKSVSDSVKFSEQYYHNNLGIINNLLLLKKKLTPFIFSSSATVYDYKKKPPYLENDPVAPINPYGSTKLLGEKILKDVSDHNNFKAISLRYFNPIGAHSSGKIGEDPTMFPNNLMPYLIDVASKKKPFLNIFGNEYPTRDGTGVRDFIHVIDIARGHIAALLYTKKMKSNFEVFNLGTGKGTTVLELVNVFKKVNKANVPYRFISKREGDLAESYAGIIKSEKLLKWNAKLTIADMCKDSWRWQQNFSNMSIDK
jgi:UDP-glucose 4-epimerase